MERELLLAREHVTSVSPVVEKLLRYGTPGEQHMAGAEQVDRRGDKQDLDRPRQGMN